MGKYIQGIDIHHVERIEFQKPRELKWGYSRELTVELEDGVEVRIVFFSGDKSKLEVKRSGRK